MQKLKRNDEVVVLSGKDKGKTGEVVSVDLKNSAVTVKGVNVVRKAIKPTQENPNGGFSEAERAINISKVSLISPKTSKPSRARIEVRDGKKVRVLVKCGTVLK